MQGGLAELEQIIAFPPRGESEIAAHQRPGFDDLPKPGEAPIAWVSSRNRPRILRFQHCACAHCHPLPKRRISDAEFAPDPIRELGTALARATKQCKTNAEGISPAAALASLGLQSIWLASSTLEPDMRPSGRQTHELRKVAFVRGVSKHAEGSCLVRFGDTHVLCTASLEERLPSWLKGLGKGWVTAEYGMLPRSTA